MNIAIVGKFYIESFGLHIKEALIDMGHSVVEIDPEINPMQNIFWGKRMANINKTIYQEIFSKIPAVRNRKALRIFKKFKSEKIDLTLVLHDFLSNSEVSEIRKITQSPIVLWFPDAISNFQKSMFFVAGYDHLFFCDKYIVQKLKNEFNLNTHYLPQCFSIFKHLRVELSDNDRIFFGCDITNAGNLYPSRAALYKHLTKYNFKMWGYPPAIWLNVPELDKIIMNKTVFNEEKSKAFSAAKIVLNNLHPAVIDGVNKRTFEIPACGGFQITSHRDALTELFEPGKEIITYHNLKDLIDKIEYYLNPENENERLQIAEAGYQRAMKEHSYQHRINKILELIK